ncbi:MULTISPECIES: DEAD/DEAH box helicase [unclassified Lentimonas]|uniref:DEAD/DEAH box helicase n=1 Tax=unclassified Lentimonas TaxID=2630993 RepID=UPI001327679B|nr:MULTISPECIES: DEAD/DEAH box helicase [unclassified Lentimonas]CAA6692804.1 ATP-dependent RNA helicase YfmL [Lentimonas sp. CC19]CAA6695029.1 ATP-dependent RNA helicase YfmL [Lentimonas sp. CC10]CAA7069642.1 ATP-dependent RNA helicase YfmL [Lentimonas sp. CC11]
MNTFKTLGLPEKRIEALTRQNITTPSDIQVQAYPTLSNQQDAWLSAPTGSGKTLAYLLPLLERIDSSSKDLQLAVLCPTQELAVQIHECILLLAKDYEPAIRSQLLIGNASVVRQKEKLKKKPHVIVGTIGRMLELNIQRKLKLHKCHMIVIDEADNMLADDNIGDVEAFLKTTPRDQRQVVFTSATDKGAAFETAQSIGTDVQWHAAQAQQVVPTIEHSFIEAPYHNKARALHQFIKTARPERAIAFVHRNESAEDLGADLERRHLRIAVLHAGLSKFERQTALEEFRSGKIKLLIASDVAARGLDIKGVTHIINVDLPSDSNDYLHRVGRTARMGESGHAISLASEDEMKLIRRYERDLKITVNEIRD